MQSASISSIPSIKGTKVRRNSKKVSVESKTDEESKPVFDRKSRNLINILTSKKERESLTKSEEERLKKEVVNAKDELKRIIGNLANTNVRVEVIFEQYEFINNEMVKEDKKEIVDCVCRSGNKELLELVCKREAKDKGYAAQITKKYPWKGNFTGFDTLTDLLEHAFNQKFPPEIVLIIAKKVFLYAHTVYNGTQYLDDPQIHSMESSLGQSSTAMGEYIKAAVQLGYKDALLAMLAGDIYHCIRLMKKEKFENNPVFVEAFDTVKDAMADVISSWVEKSCRDRVRKMLDEGVEIDTSKTEMNSLINMLDDLGIEVSRNDKRSKENLIKKLKKDVGGEEVRLRLEKTVVGALMSTLFINEAMKNGSFRLDNTYQEKSKRKEKVGELSKQLNGGESIDDTLLDLIKLLNSGSHFKNSWFFREVLENVVKEKLGKLKAVCIAICKEDEVHVDVLEYFGVKVAPPKSQHSTGNMGPTFSKDAKTPSEEATEAVEKSEDEFCVPAVSEQSRKSVADLKSTRNDLEQRLKKEAFDIRDDLKKRIDVLHPDSIDVEDIFNDFDLINSEIAKEDKREIVELICRRGNVALLEMICKREMEDALKDQCSDNDYSDESSDE